VNGDEIDILDSSDSNISNIVFTGATDPYDCCVSAILDPLGAFWGYSSVVGCGVFETFTCGAAPDQTTSGSISTGATGNGGLTVGNAYCGEINGE